MLIRPMMPEDSVSVSQIDQRCFSDAWEQKTFEELFLYETNHYIVAVSEKPDEKICGFAGISVSIDTADVMNIAVLPEYRRDGTGRSLLRKLEEIAKRCGCIQVMLEVREGNIPARSLYEAEGYEVISIRKNYYSRPVEHGLIMRKNI